MSGMAMSWGPTTLGAEPLIRKSRESGGTFHVRRVSPENQKNKEQVASDVLRMLEELLQATEDIVNANRKYKNKFDTMLKKKFLDKSDAFACLDPFLCEFQYERRKVSFIGDAAPSELARGVLRVRG
jgi:hypothetical protein